MTMRALAVLSLCVLFWPQARAPQSAKDKADMVKYFLKTPVEDLPSNHIDEFLAIDPESLPKKLREKYRGKRLELYTLKRLAASKKKASLRTPEPDCDISKEYKSS